jgi:starvation-inducible DNA-binding protein
MDILETKTRRAAPLHTPSGLGSNAVRDVSGALTALLADMLALYLKTKNFHWHVSGAHFREDHLMLDDQSKSSRSHLGGSKPASYARFAAGLPRR